MDLHPQRQMALLSLAGSKVRNLVNPWKAALQLTGTNSRLAPVFLQGEATLGHSHEHTLREYAHNDKC